MSEDDLERITNMPDGGYASQQCTMASGSAGHHVHVHPGVQSPFDSRLVLAITWGFGALVGYEFHHIARYFRWIAE